MPEAHHTEEDDLYPIIPNPFMYVVNSLIMVYQTQVNPNVSSNLDAFIVKISLKLNLLGIRPPQDVFPLTTNINSWWFEQS